MSVNMVLINTMDSDASRVEFVELVSFADRKEFARYILEFFLDSLEEDGFIIYENSDEVVTANDSLDAAAAWLTGTLQRPVPDDNAIPF